MLHAILEYLQPMLTEVLLTLILAGLAWVMRFLPAKYRLDVEGRHREALHKALTTGVDLALAGIERGALTVPGVAQIDAVTGYVWRSVPDAIKALGPSPEFLRDMAVAKLEAALRGDALAAALKDAMGPEAR